MNPQQIEIMCLVVEEYIFRLKGRKVRINRQGVMSDVRQMALLMNAYQTASNGNQEHSNISEEL